MLKQLECFNCSFYGNFEIIRLCLVVLNELIFQSEEFSKKVNMPSMSFEIEGGGVFP